MSTMLYKRGTALKQPLGDVDFIIVEDHEVEGALADGWLQTPWDCYAEDQPKRRGRPPKDDA